MVDNDIYDNKTKYEHLIEHIDRYLNPPEGARKYQVKHKANLRFVEKLTIRFEAKDISYSRRLRLMRGFLLACHYAEKDFAEFDRDDIDRLLVYAHRHNSSEKTKSMFICDLKHLWKIILPDKDEKVALTTPFPPTSCAISAVKSTRAVKRFVSTEFQSMNLKSSSRHLAVTPGCNPC